MTGLAEIICGIAVELWATCLRNASPAMRSSRTSPVDLLRLDGVDADWTTLVAHDGVAVLTGVNDDILPSQTVTATDVPVPDAILVGAAADRSRPGAVEQLL